MSYHIKTINFESENDDIKKYYIKNQDAENQDVENHIINNLGKINIFVGENNSGKSSFLRQIQSIDSICFSYIDNAIMVGINEIYKSFCSSYNSFIQSTYINRQETIRILSVLDNENLNYIYSNQSFLGLDKIVNEKNKNRSDNIQNNYNYTNDVLEKHKLLLNDFISKNLSLTDFNFEKIYIPVLRGLRHPIHKDSSLKEIIGKDRLNQLGIFDFSKERTLSDYHFIKDKTDVFTGLSLYEDIKKLLLGTHEAREIIRDFENFLSENFFNNELITLTPKHDSDVIHVSIGKTKDIAIYDLGDGIQSIIILTFPLFKNQGKKLLVFIEEPELFLHPGMQRILVETFLDKRFDGFQYFIATHSNHLLDLTLDLEEEAQISIFTCKKDSNEDKKFIIENVSSSDNSPLKLLGVRNSSIFLSNCTIWVEGITDRLYLRHYLKLYQEYKNKKDKSRIYKEDLHFSFVEYSGGNITHWSFLGDGSDEKPTINYEKICNKIFLIADKDYEDNINKKKDPEKIRRHQKLKGILGKNFQRLNCTEIENLIKEHVLISVIEEFEPSLKIEKSVTQEEYATKRLGRFIDKKLLTISKRKGKNAEGKLLENNYKYAEKSGTIKEKERFCNSALKYTKIFDTDLSNEAQALCELIYNFIEEQNKN